MSADNPLKAYGRITTKLKPFPGQFTAENANPSKALQNHINAAHGGKVVEGCPACREIQRLYGGPQ